MPRINLQSALAEKEERDGDLCKTCTAVPDEEWEPYCIHCGMYWKEVDEGLWDEAWA